MRLGSLASARPNYYDRNATTYEGTYFADLGPHAETVRTTITIAAGKKLLVEACFLYVYRSTVPSAGNQYASRLKLNGNIYAMSLNTGTALGSNTYQTFALAITAYPGDIVTQSTFDTSTGGTVFYQADAKGTQYDA